MKALLTKNNSSWGIIINVNSPNEFRHSIAFKDIEKRDEFISLELFDDINYDWKTKLDQQPDYAFNISTATKGVITVRLSDYNEETIFSLLNKDFAIVKNDEGHYLFYALSGGIYDGKHNITFNAELDIPFTYNILFQLKNDYVLERTHIDSNFINNDETMFDGLKKKTNYQVLDKKLIEKNNNFPVYDNLIDRWNNDKKIRELEYYYVQIEGTNENDLFEVLGSKPNSNANQSIVSNYRLDFLPNVYRIKIIQDTTTTTYLTEDILAKYMVGTNGRVLSIHKTQYCPFEIGPGKENTQLGDLFLNDWYFEDKDTLVLDIDTSSDTTPISFTPLTEQDKPNTFRFSFNYIRPEFMYYSNIFELNLNDYLIDQDKNTLQSGVNDVIFGYANTLFKYEVPKDNLKNEIIYFHINLNFIGDLTSAIYLINDEINDQGILDIANLFPISIDNQAEYQSNNKGSILNKKITLAIGGIASAVGVVATGGALIPVLTAGGVAYGAFSSTANRRNLKNQGDKVSNNSFNSYIDNFIFDSKFSVWIESSNDSSTEIFKTKIKLFGNEMKQLISDPFTFGEKQRYQYFKILETFENINLNLGSDVKQIINEIFEFGITFWFYENALEWKGVKYYDQIN